MGKFKSVLSFFIIMGFAGKLLAAQKVSNCVITFKTKGKPVLVMIEGKSDSPCTGTLVNENGNTAKSVIAMDLQKLDTGIPLRNKHLKENYLHTDKYQTATLTELVASDIENQIKGSVKGKSPFSANMELHGVKKPVKGLYEVKGGNNYTGEFEIDLPDFGIDRPSFMGVKVVDKVYINFKFRAE